MGETAKGERTRTGTGAGASGSRSRPPAPASAAEPGRNTPDDAPSSLPSEVLADASLSPPQVEPATLRLKELVDQVAIRTGAPQRDVRAVVDAVLVALGQALDADRPLALPPFGKARVIRHKETIRSDTLTLKLRRGHAGKHDEGLAETDE